MNTDYLREFVVFAGHMSFTSAARTLSLSQPTLSRHISELERQYGCKLVDRSSQALRLTYCGRVLLQQAPELIALEETIDMRMASARAEPCGNLTIERYRKSPLIQGMMQRAASMVTNTHPGYTVVRRPLRAGETSRDAVARGEIDEGIIACTTDHTAHCPVTETEGIGSLELTGHRERIYFVVSVRDSLASCKSASFDDIAGHCLVFPLNPEFARCQPDVERLLGERGHTLRWRPYELDDVEELGLMRIEPNEAFIVVESAAASPDTYYLHNPDLRLIPCSDDVWVTRYLIFSTNSDNPVLHSFLDAMAHLDSKNMCNR
jgi:DNA-binding transcriptional LysR family regulator